jgi:hypothetical protein
MVDRRHRRLRQGARAGRRRLPRRPKGSDLELQVGLLPPGLIEAPEGISFEVPQPTAIEVSGIDKVLVGQVAANIRKVRPPEPYKGKGIKYEGESSAARPARPPGAEPADPHDTPTPTIQRCRDRCRRPPPCGLVATQRPRDRTQRTAGRGGTTRSTRSMDPTKKRVARRTRQLRAASASPAPRPSRACRCTAATTTSTPS